MSTSARILMHRARMACEAVAEGPFTPIVFERYEYIGGERGWRLGYPIECGKGHGITWSDRPALADWQRGFDDAPYTAPAANASAAQWRGYHAAARSAL